MPLVRFSVSGIPVRVRWSFWPVALLIVPLPYSLLLRPRAWGFVAVWLAVVFVTVMIHELAHAVTARRAGADTSITLYFLGGFTEWESDDISHARRAWVAASGSLAGFGVGGATWLLLESGAVDPELTHLVFGLENLWFVNVVWGALNWIPVRPLDGGHIFLNTMTAALGETGRRIADVVFPLVTIAAGAWAVVERFYLAAGFAAIVLFAEIEIWRGRESIPIETEDVDGSPEREVG